MSPELEQLVRERISTEAQALRIQVSLCFAVGLFALPAAALPWAEANLNSKNKAKARRSRRQLRNVVTFVAICSRHTAASMCSNSSGLPCTYGGCTFTLKGLQLARTGLIDESESKFLCLQPSVVCTLRQCHLLRLSLTIHRQLRGRRPSPQADRSWHNVARARSVRRVE